jgi:hypothetical protein
VESGTCPCRRIGAQILALLRASSAVWRAIRERGCNVAGLQGKVSDYDKPSAQICYSVAGFGRVCLVGALAAQPASSQTQKTIVEALKPNAMGYAESAEALRVYYELYGQGEPIVVMAGA